MRLGKLLIFLPPRRIIPIIVVFLVGISLSSFVATLVANNEKQSVASRFEDAARERLLAIHRGIGQTLGVLEAVTSFFRSSDSVDNQAFHDFVSPLLQRNPQIAAVEYIPRVAEYAATDFEVYARKLIPGYAIVNEQRERLEQAVDGSFFPVFFRQSNGDLPDSAGVDLNASPSFRRAMAQARDSEHLVSSERFQYPGAAPGEYYIRVFEPLYATAFSESSIEVRRQQHIGFVCAVIRIGGIVEDSLEGFSESNIDLIIEDLSAEVGERFLYSSSSTVDPRQPLSELMRAHNHRVSHSQLFFVAGRQWLLVAMPQGNAYAPSLWVSRLVFGGGVLLTLAVALYIIGLLRVNEIVRKAVQSQTAELAQANISLRQEVRQRKRTAEALRESEERFRAVLVHSSAIISLKDIDGRYRLVNHRFEEVHNCRNEDVIGRTDEEIFDAELAQRFRQNDLQVLSEKKAFEFDEFVFVDGDKRIFLSVKFPIYDREGVISAIGSISTDITARRRVEDRLRASEARIRLLLESVGEGVFGVDIDGRFSFVNPACVSLLGYTRSDELLGRSFRSILHHEEEESLVEDLLNERKPIVREHVRFRRADGQVIFVNFRSYRLVGEGHDSGAVVTFDDVTEQKQAQEALALSEQSIRAFYKIASSTNDSFVDRIQALLELGCDRFGLTSGMLTRLDGGDCRIVHCYSRDGDFCDNMRLNPDNSFLRTAVSSEAPVGFEDARFPGLVADDHGGSYDVRSYIGARVVTNNEVYGTLHFTSRDRRSSIFSSADYDFLNLMARWVGEELERRKVDKELRLAATVFENTDEAIVIADAQNRIVAVNSAFTRITGYTFDDVVGRSPLVLEPDPHQDESYHAVISQVIESGHWHGERRNRKKNGEIFAGWQSISVVKDDEGVKNFVWVIADISAIKESEERLNFLAHHDELTGLPNRLLFAARLESAVVRAKRHGQRVALLFIDLDRFKTINDTLGHACGDRLLERVSQRLLACVREEDTVARLGGDEFTVLLSEVTRINDAGRVAQKILDSLVVPFDIDDQQIVTSASIGISIYPDNAKGAEDLVRAADAAMYRAKEQGRNTYQLYTSDLTEKIVEHWSLENNLRRAINENEFLLYYQPQVALRTGELVGVEALIRWQVGDGELLMPDRFIKVAEETGLIHRIGEWVIFEACAQASLWRKQGLPPLRIAINLSGRQLLHDPQLCNRIEAAIEQYKIPPNYLEFEITETVLQTAENSVRTLTDLKALGVSLAIDDFGIGYSCLSSLKRLPIDKVKVDRSFVRDIPFDQNDEAIAKAIIAMGRSLRLTVVGEGVETEAQRQFLARHGCEEMQGYLYSRPLSADQVSTLLRESQRQYGPH